MHIIIYGVGRSGTKAVQLYLSYLLALKEGRVWINYEPYFWLDRKTKIVNFEGFYHNSHSPHFATSSSEFSKGHIRFLKKLSNHPGSIITKFIRGNGRARAISDILQPDHSIIIIRDLYEVLLSVMKTEWDFWSVGWDYQVNWSRFVEEVRKKNIVENLDWCIDQIEDRIDQNAFYWYAMNLAALQVNPEKYYWIHYKQIGKIEEIAMQILNVPNLDESFRSQKFSGDFLHQDYPLQSNENTSFHYYILNQVLYKTQLFKRYGWYIPHAQIGSSASVNKDYSLVEEKTRGPSIIIEKRDLYEFFNEDIKKKFDRIFASGESKKAG